MLALNKVSKSYVEFESKLKKHMRESGFILTCASSEKSKNDNDPLVYKKKVKVPLCNEFETF